MTSTAVRLGPEEVSAGDAQAVTDQLASTDVLVVGDVRLPLSPRVRAVLAELFGQLAAGHAVDIVPVTEWLTTSEAAGVLHVSRPTLVALLDSGAIDYDQPAVHRRISRAALDAFLEQRRDRRAAALDDLAQTEVPSQPDDFVETR